MGTRLVYNYQQQKWIPYVSDPDKWYQHLLDIRDGYAESDSQGHYIVGSGRKYRELKEMRQKEKPVVNLVTSEAQALEMAKSELKRKGEDSITDGNFGLEFIEILKDDQYVDCYRTLAYFRKDINVKRNDYVKGYCLYELEIDPYYILDLTPWGPPSWIGSRGGRHLGSDVVTSFTL